MRVVRWKYKSILWFVGMLICCVPMGLFYWTGHILAGGMFVIIGVVFMILCVINGMKHQDYKKIITNFDKLKVGEYLFFENIDRNVFNEIMSELKLYIDKKKRSKNVSYVNGSFRKIKERY